MLKRNVRRKWYMKELYENASSLIIWRRLQHWCIIIVSKEEEKLERSEESLEIDLKLKLVFGINYVVLVK